MTDKTLRRKAHRLEERRQNEYAETVKSLMRTPEGRAFMFEQLERCHIGSNPYVRDTDKTAFNCGEMNVGLRLQEDILRHAPGGYITMLKEAENERRHIDAELERVDTDNPQRDLFGDAELPAGERYDSTV